MKHVTLLFAHGGGFCKETWKPIIRRRRESPVLSTAGVEIVTFDFKYHGSRRDESVAPVIDRTNPKSLRVHHPAQDLVRWSSADVMEQTQGLRAKRPASASEHLLIGIGHSMGATALWSIEVQRPGIFDGPILFEPGFIPESAEGEAVKDSIVAVTLQRENCWPSRDNAVVYFDQLKNYEKWDREVLAGYLRGAMVDEPDGSVTLACHLHIEAAIYCQTYLYLSAEELSRPKCKVHFHYGHRTKMLSTALFEEVQAQCPEIYTLHPPIPNTSHLMVFEDPEASAHRITTDLAGMEAFQPRSSM